MTNECLRLNSASRAVPRRCCSIDVGRCGKRDVESNEMIVQGNKVIGCYLRCISIGFDGRRVM